MSEPEPDGCYQRWDDHTCIDDQWHTGDCRCTCGATKIETPTTNEEAGR